MNIIAIDLPVKTNRGTWAFGGVREDGSRTLIFESDAIGVKRAKYDFAKSRANRSARPKVKRNRGRRF